MVPGPAPTPTSCQQQHVSRLPWFRSWRRRPPPTTPLGLLLQCGFALLESGSIRAKNVRNILLKNAVDACIGTMWWWAVGYAFAYGSCGQNGFIGEAAPAAWQCPLADLPAPPLASPLCRLFRQHQKARLPADAPVLGLVKVP